MHRTGAFFVSSAALHNSQYCSHGPKMPYKWTTLENSTDKCLHLWPHQSLSQKGMAAFVLATFVMITLPLLGLLGTKLLWALLPFMLCAVGGIWFALNKSNQDRNAHETLQISGANTLLTRTNPKAATQSWECNTYWLRVHLHATSGPVPDYVTLSGNGREVEIGAFLGHEERKQLYSDLQEVFASRKQPND